MPCRRKESGAVCVVSWGDGSIKDGSGLNKSRFATGLNVGVDFREGAHGLLASSAKSVIKADVMADGLSPVLVCLKVTADAGRVILCGDGKAVESDCDEELAMAEAVFDDVAATSCSEV